MDNFINNGNDVVKLEGGKFTLIQADNWYAIRRNSDSSILGWASVEENTDHFNIGMYYILPKYRAKSAAAVVLFNAIKGLMKKPLVLDSIISQHTDKLLTALSRRSK